jgi:hypothetical protein
MLALDVKMIPDLGGDLAARLTRPSITVLWYTLWQSAPHYLPVNQVDLSRVFFTNQGVIRECQL